MIFEVSVGLGAILAPLEIGEYGVFKRAVEWEG